MELKILNLTQHPPTPAQTAAGVWEPKKKTQIQQLLTFEEMPTYAEIERRAETLAAIALEEVDEAANVKVMVGGAPYLMAPLEKALRRKPLIPVYAFSKREILEETMQNGTVVKTQAFKHLGFIEATK